ncbi:hypothetical protein K7X08_008107 [Anisodus acutangulus]|uniref:Uncharacterized protein n=1 Tax=Anisodus acutangulus TaxID=402998 RepID=A0A9Q1MTU2_9SOLA|nr:hypothetical protein K7X08_008107 [Anisodus acutangulus]
MLEFDRSAFIIASTATEDEMYREHVVWTDKTVNLKLLRKGILTHIYAPVVIVQGLRESGVFSSIVSSAQESLSKDKFLASFENSNSTKAAASESLPSRKIGRNQHSQAARRVLEESASHFELHEEAVPPRPPPGVDVDVITEA